VLVINCGSSSLKFDVIDNTDGQAATRLASGEVSGFGAKAKLELSYAGDRQDQAIEVQDHEQAAEAALARLGSIGFHDFDAIGHRVVHGGNRFTAPVRIDAAVREAIEAVGELAPLHNAAALTAIDATARLLPGVPSVATFDTVFFAGLPEVAATYALPFEVSEGLGIRRFGFHGFAHRSMAEGYAARTGRQDARLITLQLGSGCSAAAIAAGSPVDTSMGFTPLEGLVMATRSGDIDPALPEFIASKQGRSAEEVTADLNERSGLLGVSGVSGDMRQLLSAEREGDKRAALASELFCYRIRKYIGAYLAVLGGAEAVIFGGGIGENSAEVRKRCLAGLEWAGLKLDSEANENTIGHAREISAGGAAIQCFVLPVDEAAIIADDTRTCLEDNQ
jgi:acetate kinase